MYQVKLECDFESQISALLAIIMYFFPQILNGFIFISEQDKFLFSY